MHGTEPVDELPKLKEPWQFIIFRDLIIATNPDHCPMAKEDGTKKWIAVMIEGQPKVDILLFDKSWMFYA